jgi:hypothetical protein
MTDLDALIAERESGMPRWHCTPEAIAERRRILEEDYPTSGTREYSKPKRRPRVKSQTELWAEQRAYVCGEVEHLAGTDHPDRIAQRLGYRDRKSLIEVLTRWGRRDLARLLYVAQEAAA